MNENLRLKFTELNNRKIKMVTNLQNNIRNLDKDIIIEHEFALVMILNTLTGIETILNLCDILKIELPVDLYNVYSKRITEQIHIVDKYSL